MRDNSQGFSPNLRMEQQKWLSWLLHSEFHCAGCTSIALSWFMLDSRLAQKQRWRHSGVSNKKNSYKQKELWDFPWLLYWFLFTLIDHPPENILRWYNQRQQWCKGDKHMDSSCGFMGQLCIPYSNDVFFLIIFKAYVFHIL